MNTFIVLTLCVTSVFAAPYYSSNDAFAGRQSSINTYYSASRKPNVSILKQIQQLNDDGSYTFGYEASDGAFQVETKDSFGYVIGKYGFYDGNGKFQVIDYVAGKGLDGKNLGFQAKGDLIPDVPKKNRGASSTAQQRALDFEYSSVDDDEDGFPDRASNYQIVQPVRVNYQQQRVVQPVVRQEIGGYQQKTVQPVVRIENPTYQTVANPVVRLETPKYQRVPHQPVVRLETAEYQPKAAQPVGRLDSLVYNTNAQSTVRLGNEYQKPASFLVASPSFNLDTAQHEPDVISIDSSDFFGRRII